jgi:hypothetical protein
MWRFPNSGSSKSCYWSMGPGVISDCPSSSSVCHTSLGSRDWSGSDISIRRFFLQEHYSLFDAILGKLPPRICVDSLVDLKPITSVFTVQRLFRTSRLRIVDMVILQRRLHHSSASRHRYFRPVRLCTNARPIPAIISARAVEQFLYPNGILAMDWERFLPQCCTCAFAA